MSRQVVTVLGLAVVVGVAVIVLRRNEPRPAPPPPTNESPVPKAPDPAPPPVPAVGPAVERPERSTPASHPDWLAFPDGSAYPPLNGVAKAPKLIWHKMVPFAPVVGVERDAHGRDWYVHENGARSTTYIDAAGRVMGDIMLDKPAAAVAEEPTEGAGIPVKVRK